MPDQTGALIAPYMGTSPRIAGRLAYAGPGATVLGRATLGKGRGWAISRSSGRMGIMSRSAMTCIWDRMPRFISPMRSIPPISATG